jgi:hypothetical protein
LLLQALFEKSDILGFTLKPEPDTIVLIQNVRIENKKDRFYQKSMYQ